jgi:hypothetical protein
VGWRRCGAGYRRLVLVLPWATVVVRGYRADGMAVLGVSSTDAPPSRGGARDSDVTAQDDPEPTPEQAAEAVARMERLSRLSATDAVRMRQRAVEKKSHAADRTAHGDRIGAHFDLAEADALERDALDVLDPLTHTTAPVQIGRGGELATGAAMMQPYVDTVRSHPDWLTHDASRERMDLASEAGALTMGLDAAETVQAANSLEKMLAHQMASAHSMAMKLQVEAHELIRTYKRTGYAHQQLSIEAGRLLNASARMMETYQHGMLTLQKVRSGGQQTVVVQHVNVGDGGRAMVAGQVKLRGKKRCATPAKVEGQVEK